MIRKSLVATGLVVGSFILGFAGQAEAANLLRSWDVTEAFNDSSSRGYGDGHVAWLPDMIGGGTFIADGDFTFNEYDNNTAHFFGSIEAKNDANKSWDVNIWFERDETTIGTVGPKIELKNSAYVDNGGTVDPNSWYYYNIVQPTEGEGFHFTSTAGEYDGQKFNVADASGGKYLAQVGKGANGKNTNMGMSFWFKYDGMNKAHSDFNVDLTAQSIPENVPVPEPATMSLVGLGIVSLGASALKRKQS